MSVEQFAVHHEAHPSAKLEAIAAEAGVSPRALMRDYSVIGGEGSALVVAVGDMADNLTGTTYRQPELACVAGLPEEYPLNGGLVGSIALRYALMQWEEAGEDVIPFANNALDMMYRQLDMGSASELDPAELFTGYLAHARLTDETTTITSVGDVRVWVNGGLVAGAEKAVDTAKDKLITDCTAALQLGVGEQVMRFANIAMTFGEKARWGYPGSQELYARLITATSDVDSPDRQTVYRAVDNFVTPWQIRELQNQLYDRHPWAYGAIDGRRTPDEYVNIHPIPTADIETLVIATDGSRPRWPERPVRSWRDLVPVNPEYSEQTIVTLTRK